MSKEKRCQLCYFSYYVTETNSRYSKAVVTSSAPNHAHRGCRMQEHKDEEEAAA